MSCESHAGKCKRCNVRYCWDGLPLTRDAVCPACGEPLAITRIVRNRDTSNTISIVIQTPNTRRVSNG